MDDHRGNVPPHCWKGIGTQDQSGDFHLCQVESGPGPGGDGSGSHVYVVVSKEGIMKATMTKAIDRMIEAGKAHTNVVSLTK